MEILSKPCGDFMTNCYIIKGNSGQIVIDPGQDSFSWITQNTDRILAVLNTHGHFDHTFDDENLQILGHKIYIHEKDAFFLEKDP
ncbi:MAG: MBL fold metallo-hydrolase, partial [Campylobacter sp.]|nr:MBL fold metallo-hydrolase [Campylobacter sp.]